jgi:hypothetical protein
MVLKESLFPVLCIPLLVVLFHVDPDLLHVGLPVLQLCLAQPLLVGLLIFVWLPGMPFASALVMSIT